MVTITQSVQIWVWSVVLLTLKMFGVSLYTGLKRRASHSPASPEDAALLLRGADAEPSADPADVQRGLNLHRNDMENVYLYMFVSFLFPVISVMSAQPPDYLPDAFAAYNLTFLLARYAYSACYVFGWQPWRSIFFWIGQLDTIIFAIWCLPLAMTLSFQ